VHCYTACDSYVFLGATTPIHTKTFLDAVLQPLHLQGLYFS
jgi:hypothetical protein